MTARVAIRADASTAIGTGHLKRCLSLAQALTDAGAEVRFVCRALDAVAAQVLHGSGLHTLWLPAPAQAFTPAPDAPPHAAWAGVPQAQDAGDTAQALAGWAPDWLVVDHYAFDARWHRSVRKALGCCLLVIDDTADRALDADALLDHNWDADHRAKYASRLQREPHWLCGPRFALLSSPYQHAPRYGLHDSVRSIGIFMGGTDPGGMSARALTACRLAGFTGPVGVVSTSSNPHLAGLRQACMADGHATLTLDAPDLADFFARHDLQIGAGGGATWERCCIGAPTIALALADNQSWVLQGIDQLGAVIWCRNAHDLPTWIRETNADRSRRASLYQQSTRLVDGCGSERVACHLLKDTLHGSDQPPA